jgi:signal recognition particle GTPase
MNERFQFSLLPSFDSGLFTIGDLRQLFSEALSQWPDNEETSRVRRQCGIIDSMTAKERQTPVLAVSHSRRLRIAVGAGATPSEVKELIRYYDQLAKVIRQMTYRHSDKH